MTGNVGYFIGDSRNMEHTADDSVDLVFTHPPAPELELSEVETFRQQKCQTFKEKHDYLEGVWKECLRVLKPHGIMALQVRDTVRHKTFINNRLEIENRCIKLGFQELVPIVVKHFMMQGNIRMTANPIIQVEFVLLFRKDGSSLFDGIIQQVWQIGKADAGARGGDSELARKVIETFSHQGDLVLDPFLGTGTTIKVALELDRNGMGYEIQKELEPVIVQKISQLTQTTGER